MRSVLPSLLASRGPSLAVALAIAAALGAASIPLRAFVAWLHQPKCVLRYTHTEQADLAYACWMRAELARPIPGDPVRHGLELTFPQDLPRALGLLEQTRPGATLARLAVTKHFVDAYLVEAPGDFSKVRVYSTFLLGPTKATVEELQRRYLTVVDPNGKKLAFLRTPRLPEVEVFSFESARDLSPLDPKETSALEDVGVVLDVYASRYRPAAWKRISPAPDPEDCATSVQDIEEGWR